MRTIYFHMKKNYLVRALAAVTVLLSPMCANAYDAEINGIYYNFLSRSKVAKVVITASTIVGTASNWNSRV